MLRELKKSDAQALQAVFDACIDYAELQDGMPFPSDAAEAEFDEVPPGFPIERKRIFGIEDSTGSLIGLVEGLAGYPNDETWFIGLMLMVPEARGQGIGRSAFNALQRHIRAEGAFKAVQLAVLEENKPAYQFWCRLGFQFAREVPTARFGAKSHKRLVLNKALGDA